MKAALISLGSVSSQWTLAAMKQHFKEVDAIDIRNIEIGLGSPQPEVLCSGKPIGKYDCVYAKGSFRFVPTLRAVTSALYKTAYMPIKPATFTIGHDKLLTHLAFQHHNIPMPTTYLASSLTAAKKILEKINYPIILKLPSGTGGKGVMYAESYAAASSLLDTLTTLRQPFLIQEYIETGGEDIRIIVGGDKILASMKRKAGLNEKRANIHSGGEGEPFSPDAHMKKISVEAAKAVGADLCAVDILEGAKGPLVVEVNLSPGIQGITKATGADVAGKIAKFLFERTHERKQAGTSVEAQQLMKEINRGNGAQNDEQQIITNLDFRGERILLPKLATEMTKFSEKDEFVLKIAKGKLTVERA
ncbi:RimK family alpha-L-glutamate ligase [Candidatus Woesearchaeota archaeon]|nr:RimK family alpha-L-glutamate ligase [Candidatus Woesearchaeota archaeon]